MLDRIRKRQPGPASPGRYVVWSALILAMLVAPFAGGFRRRRPHRRAERGTPATTRAPRSRARRRSSPRTGRTARASPTREGGRRRRDLRVPLGPRPRAVRARQQLENGRAFEFRRRAEPRAASSRSARRSQHEGRSVQHERGRTRGELERRPRRRPARERHRGPGEGSLGRRRGGRRRAAQERRCRKHREARAPASTRSCSTSDVTACAYNVTLGLHRHHRGARGRDRRLAARRQREGRGRGHP